MSHNFRVVTQGRNFIHKVFSSNISDVFKGQDQSRGFLLGDKTTLLPY